jgi:hypothetical protein
MLLPKDLLKDVKHTDKAGVKARVKAALEKMDTHTMFFGMDPGGMDAGRMTLVSSMAYFPATGTIFRR